jgi:hypothetical protein
MFLFKSVYKKNLYDTGIIGSNRKRQILKSLQELYLVKWPFWWCDVISTYPAIWKNEYVILNP